MGRPGLTRRGVDDYRLVAGAGYLESPWSRRWKGGAQGDGNENAGAQTEQGASSIKFLGGHMI